jgi:hypothetical protein
MNHITFTFHAHAISPRWDHDITSLHDNHVPAFLLRIVFF